jgi:peptidyl-prolyl cis-trans isomerase SurA
VTFPAPRLTLLPLAAALLVLAGCGSSNGSPSVTSVKLTPAPTGAALGSHLTPVTSPTPIATAVITGGSVAAIVNGHKIPMSTYRVLYHLTQQRSAGTPGVTPTALGEETMNEVIIEELVQQYSQAHHLTIPKAEVDLQIKSAEQQAGGPAAFRTRLQQVGMSMALYRQLLTNSLLTQQVERQVAPPSNKLQPVAQVRHILIATHPQGKPTRSDAQAKAKAEQLLKQIQQGGNFAGLAKASSDDPGSATQGGNLGTIRPGQTVPPFDHAVFTLPLHHPAIVKSVYGYHIIEVLSRGKAKPNAQAQQQSMQVGFQAWLNKQLQSAHIVKLAKVKS